MDIWYSVSLDKSSTQKSTEVVQQLKLKSCYPSLPSCLPQEQALNPTQLRRLTVLAASLIAVLAAERAQAYSTKSRARELRAPTSFQSGMNPERCPALCISTAGCPRGEEHRCAATLLPAARHGPRALEKHCPAPAALGVSLANS